MRRMIPLAAAMILLIGLAATPVLAADATATIDINSAYVWRGLTFNDGMVIQPSIDVAAKNGLGINVWGNYDIGDYDNTLDENEFSEIDLTVSYAFTVSKLDISIGAIEYTFPTTDPNGDGTIDSGTTATTELYVSLGMPIIGGLSAGLNIYYDIDALDAFSYANLSLSYAYAINDKLNLEAGGSIGYAGGDFAKAYGGDDGGLYDYNLSLSVGYTISEAWSASAKVTYVNALDDNHLKEVKDGGLLDTNTIYGVSIAYAF
jgi:hypothetical protein